MGNRELRMAVLMMILFIILFGMSLGGVLNPSNWVLYVVIMGVPVDVVKRFGARPTHAVCLAASGAAMLLIPGATTPLALFALNYKRVAIMYFFGAVIFMAVFNEIS